MHGRRAAIIAGRVYFGPDGMLYVTIGDRDRICCNAQQLRADGSDDNSLRMKSQALDNHVGKTLRLRDDGTVPPDNPFVGKPGAKPEIFTYGHRNGYGLAVHPETGELWQAEIGPMGGDEVNILAPGHNYGWPLVSMGRNYTGTLASDQPFARAGHGQRAHVLGARDQPVEHHVLHRRQVPAMEEQPVRRCADDSPAIRVAFGQPWQAERREGLLVAMGCAFAMCSRALMAISMSRPKARAVARRLTAWSYD